MKPDANTPEDLVPAEKTQNYSNHAQYDPMWHFVAFPIVMIGFFVAVVHALRAGDKDSIWTAVYSFGVLVAVFTARTQTLRVQNRVIRLEMRMRLREVLPAALHARIVELTPSQLVGLRFASDAELSALVERCLKGELPNGGTVKKEVRDWQSDWLRA